MLPVDVSYNFVRYFFFFFCNVTATTDIYNLSLHDALPIYQKIVSSICAYMDNEGTDELKDRISKLLNPDDEFYLLTDLGFGSVNQVVSQFMSDNVHVITGVNLPFTLELALAVKNNQPINIANMVDEARQQLFQVSTIDSTGDDDDE